jgi:hypothetical protein
MDHWQALVNKVMNLQVPQILGISCVPEQLLASQEELSSMELAGSWN